MSKTKVIIKRPDEKAGHVTSISMTLKNLQKIVEGHIEVLTIGKDPKVVMICNEEGKLPDLPKSFRIGGPIFFDTIRGTVIICGADGDDFADVPISFATWKEYLKAWCNEI
ncbi:MAG: DUF3846 domain-containing protein [Oscillospiraceae bacterium]|nr:DUF3846 domain-containing protein [Oscillospiraceae bacterium]